MDKVNIDQWFEQMRNQELSDGEKKHIYSRINEQMNKTLFIDKFRWYAKAWSLVAAIAVATLLFFAAYNPSSPEELMVVDTTNSAVTTLKPTPNPTLVNASTVGELIAVDWDIAVFKWEEEIDTQNLDSWDIVLLKENARVELSVRQWVRATITGPAKFTIEHVTVNPTNDVYMLNLLEGEFVEIKALPASEETTATEKQETVVLKTPTVEIQQLPATRNLSVTISTQNGVPTIENDWDDVIVKRLNEDTEGSITVLARNETYTVDSQEKLTQETAEQLTQALEDDTFAIRYEVEEDSTVLLQWADEKAKEEVVEEVDIPEIPQKRVLDQAVLAQLEKALSPQYTDNHTKNINTFIDNPDAQNIALANLAGSVNKARASVGLSGVDSSLSSIQSWLQGLQSHLQETYFVSPWLTNRLNTIISTLNSAKEAIIK